MMSLLKTVFSAALVLAILSACQTAPQQAQPPVNPEAAAVKFLSQGLLKEAANEYLRLAESAQAARRPEFLMKAAFVLNEAGEPWGARRLLDQIEVTAISAGLQLRRALLLAELALLDRAWQDTLTLLPAENATKYPRELRARMLELRALAFQQAGNYLELARERVNMEAVLVGPEDIAENRRLIWQAVSKMTPTALDQARIPPPDVLGGWLGLGRIAGQFLFDPTVMGQMIQTWQASYDRHPANAEIVPTLLYASELEAKTPERIALLLPFGGPFEQAADAIRDGFIATWFADQRDDRPQILVRDTTGQDIVATLNQVLEEGVDLVVGPLRKNLVSDLAKEQSLPVTTLALNYADGDLPGMDSETGKEPPAAEGLYQFALSPEAEAKLVAERAWFDGRGRAAVIAPDGDWGHRVATSFVQTWENLGGEVVSQEVYPTDAKDMGGPVKLLLNVVDSEVRLKDLRRVINRKLKHETRRRQDIDMVFMASFPNQARRLRPQLRFHHASDVPVYATSHVYSGVPDASADRDIDGVAFGDMPWVLDPNAQGLREQIGAVWPKASTAYLRLYAFGADAYDLIPHLNRLHARPYSEIPGNTGALSVNEHRQVQRRLDWAKFVNGLAKPMEQPFLSP